MFAPAKTPAAIISRLHQDTVRFLGLPETKERFFNSGVETVGSSPQEFAAIIKSEAVRLDKVIRSAGIRVN
jgi:tripartite-type tricarboxylate transporter receptor subunit TctC